MLEWLCLALCLFGAHAADILMVFPAASPSHQILGHEISKALLKRGHHVTMIGAFSIGQKLSNYTEIIPDEIAERRKRILELSNFNSSVIELISNFALSDPSGAIVLKNERVKELLRSNKTFDLAIVEVMVNECLLGLSHHFKAPTIAAWPLGSINVVNKLTGNSAPYSYVPSMLAPFTDEMTFSQRLINTLILSILQLLDIMVSLPKQSKLLRQYFPDGPPLEDLIQNVSLVLVNGHYSIVETPRPYMPNVIPVGGLHVQPQELPDDIRTFLDGAEDGAVFFSLGSNTQSANLPEDKVHVILKTFSRFKQRFLWKFEIDGLETPKNVKIGKWLPQRGILSHPNVKAFITHGGLLSVTEAVYYGVPMIGVPAFGDQHHNVAIAVNKKFAIKFDMNDLEEGKFAAAIREILENPAYKQNVALRSSLLREQPIQPMDLAVFWIEHVLKHRGAPHLQSAAVKLKWYQLQLLDVIAFLASVVIIVFYVSYVAFRKCWSFFISKFFRKGKAKIA